ncbi:MAG: FAD-dependent monooxygenase [Flavobacteriales bacterium]|nr:FAD-dependent monooxygenase [Flavobacteriales bacterium]
MNPNEKIAIAGGGLVGSLQALFLAKHGFSVDVYERRHDPRNNDYSGGRSINLALSDRGWKALDRAGVADDVKKEAIPMFGRMIHDQAGNLTYQPYGKDGQAIYSVSRGGLNKVLLERAGEKENVNLLFNHSIGTVDLEENILHVEDMNTGERSQKKYDRIFGTDGAFSAIRKRLQRTDRFNYEQRYLTHGYKELVIPGNADGTHQIEKNALHIWPRGEFMLIALPNTDGSFTCTLFFPFDGKVSFNALDTPEKVTNFFNEVFPDAVAVMPTLIQDYYENPTSSLVMISCDPWNYGDKVCLMGDASHAIVPFYGQGMNSGFEDCTVFDDIFNAHHGDWNVVFNAFSKKRKPEADAIRELALRNYIEMRDKTGDAMFLLQKKIEARFSAKHPEKWIPLYSQVTFTHIPYDEALRNGEVQDAIMKRVMNRADIADVWDSEEIEHAILAELTAEMVN